MPTALLVSCALYRHGTARMPGALKAAGFRVFAICPQSSLLEFSDHIDGRHCYSPEMTADDLTVTVARAAAQLRADIIVGCEESAVSVLTSASRLLGLVTEGSADERCLRNVQRWFGDSSWEDVHSHCVERAAAAGIRTPRQVVVDPQGMDAADLSRLGTPLLLKRDGSSAGRGVCFVSDARQVIELAASLDVAASGGIETAPSGRRIVAQEFVRGRPASVSFSALDGRMLEGFAYTVLHHQTAPFGPASVIELSNHPQLMETARRIVELTSYSGFGGIDAILPEEGGPPVFLEFQYPTDPDHPSRQSGGQRPVPGNGLRPDRPSL
ncbi:hypothetical protein [Azospirillum endophyticum]